MVANNSNSRSYTSPLRRQQKEFTQDKILEAVGTIISNGRINNFNIQEVANLAGVSYASVYRYFPTRESLLEAFYEKATEIIAETAPFEVNSIHDIPEMIRKTNSVFEDHSNIVQAFTIALLANNIQPKYRKERDKRIESMIAENNPALSKKEVKHAAVIISHLYSSLTWTTLKQRYGLNSNDTTDSINWAIKTLIQSLTRHD